LIAREDVDANVEEARGGGGIAVTAAARNPLLPAFVREVDIWAPRVVPMRGDDGRLCVEWDGAEIGEAKAV